MQSNYQDNIRRKKAKEARIHKETDKQRKKVEQQIMMDQQSLLLSKQELHKAIAQVVITPDQQLIKHIKQTNTFHDDLWQQTKKQGRMLPVESMVTLSNVVRKATQQKYGSASMVVHESYWQGLTQYLLNNKDQLTYQQIADLLWNYAYHNRKDNYFFKQLENELFQKEDEMVPLDLIEKMLYGFSFSDTGSATLYNKLASTIKIGQHEMGVLQLARCAKYFSRASDSLGGGHGIYQIAEKQITKRIPELSFNECVRVAQNMISLNLGSNSFQKQVEDRLIDQFPHDISASHLVALCKATSRHRFQENALLHKLQDIATNYVPHLSNQQVLEILWSFSRGGRGTAPLFQALEQEIMLRIDMYNLRSVSFILEGFSLVNYQSDNLIQALQQRFTQITMQNDQQANPHYLLKIVLALNKLHRTTSSFFSSILNSLSAPLLSSGQFIKLLHSIAKCEQPEFQSTFLELLEQGDQHIKSILEKQDVQEVTMLLYCISHAKSNISLPPVLDALGQVHRVPKNLFIDCFYAMLSLRQFSHASQFLPIVKQLGSFGEIKYFFDHDNFIRLVWCSFVAQMYSHQADPIQQDQWQSFQESILDINPNTLNTHTLRMWTQILSFINTFMEVQEQTIRQALGQVDQEGIQMMVAHQARITKDPEAQQQVYTLQSAIQQYFQDQQVSAHQYQVVPSFVDEYYHYLDMAIIQGNKKTGILLVDPQSYHQGEHEISLDLMLRTMKYIYGWKIIIMEHSQLISLCQESGALKQWISKHLVVRRRRRR